MKWPICFNFIAPDIRGGYRILRGACFLGSISPSSYAMHDVIICVFRATTSPPPPRPPVRKWLKQWLPPTAAADPLDMFRLRLLSGPGKNLGLLLNAITGCSKKCFIFPVYRTMSLSFPIYLSYCQQMRVYNCTVDSYCGRTTVRPAAVAGVQL